MLYSSTIISQENKFRGIVISNNTSDIIHETELYNNKIEAVKAVNNYIIANSKQITRINVDTLPPTEKKEQTFITTAVHRRCCGG
jgi:ribosomal protein L19